MPDRSTSSDQLTCTTSVADYCAAQRCDRTLAMAEHDRSLCPATITQCGTTTVIATNSVDVSTLSYYAGGRLVAVANEFFPGPRYTCQAGPESFVIPAPCAPSQSLPVCPSP